MYNNPTIEMSSANEICTFTCECNPGFSYKTESTYMKHLKSIKHKEYEKNEYTERVKNMIDKYVPK